MVVIARQPWVASEASLLSAKLVALLMMVLDHADWMLAGGAWGFHATAGRIVFPLFAYVLAVNLARVPTARHLLVTVAPRMALVGLLAMPAYVSLAGWYPANVMFTLAGATAIVAALRQGERGIAVMLFAVLGFFVDYQWFGLAAVVAAWWAVRQGAGGMVVLTAVAVLVWPVNGNWWALMAIPTLAACGYADGVAPRLKWLFYAAYPAHLLLLALVKVIA